MNAAKAIRGGTANLHMRKVGACTCIRHMVMMFVALDLTFLPCKFVILPHIALAAQLYSRYTGSCATAPYGGPLASSRESEKKGIY